MTALHPLLARQLRRLGLSSEAPGPADWSRFLAVVTSTYADADLDRDTLERSLTISSREMRELYDNLTRSTAKELARQRDTLLGVDAVKSAVLEASPDGILVIDLERRVLIYNPRFAEIWEIPPEVRASGDDRRLLAEALTKLVDPAAFIDKVEALYGDATANSQDELELLDGRYIERFSRPAVDADGQLRGRLWIFRDVTAQRRDERARREAHAFLDSIIETLPNMVFVKDAQDLRFVRLNRAGEQLLGVARDQLIGRSDHDLFPPHQAAGFVEMDRAVLAQRDVVTIREEEIQTSTGPRHLRTRKIRICDGNEQPLYLLGISEDITEERARSAELYLARDRAQTAARAKSDFLLNMSHELRTPLNAILGFARVVRRTARERLSSDELEYVDDIVTAGDHMLQLVNDLLDLRSLEAQALEVGPVEMLPPMAEAVRMVQAIARERSQEVVLDADAVLPQCLGERRAIVQILVNLLTNAVKFTPDAGRIELRARGDAGMLRLQVIDNGVGIAPADQARLFHYFEQLGAKNGSRMKGSGVGLALTRALVEKMGGAISVESALGRGSTFEVRLPVVS